MKQLFIIFSLIFYFYIQNTIAADPQKWATNNESGFSDEQIPKPFSEKLILNRSIPHPTRFSNQRPLNTTDTFENLMLFPHQDEYREYLEAIPVLKKDGYLMMIWADWNTLYYSPNEDNGHCWSEPQWILSDFDQCISLTALCTQSGRIIIIWQSNYSGLKMVYSDNNGTNWSVPQTVTENGDDRFSILTQSLDSTLWLCYCRNNEGTLGDVHYRTSSDDGLSWTSEQTLLNSPELEIFGTIISADELTLLAFYSDQTSGNWDIFSKSSVDSGATWSEPVAVLNSEDPEVNPHLVRDDEGTLWLIYYKSLPTPVLTGYYQYDIHYIKSSDGGSSWTEPQLFTRYVGTDNWHNVVMFENLPFISFCSERWSLSMGQEQIWYGVIDSSLDNNPPPAVFSYSFEDTNESSVIDIQAFVDDETGIADVKSLLWINDIGSDPIQMYDDGQHGDLSANDNVWGVRTGPFAIGDDIHFGISVKDVDNDAVDVSCGQIRVYPTHDEGNICLNLWTDSKIAEGNEGSKAYWPKHEGQDYLFLGGLWIGTACFGDPRVIDCHYSEQDWRRSPNSPVLLQKGTSDQDISFTYDDRYASDGTIGLNIKQETYQWSNPARDDFIIFRYNIYNTGESGNLSDVFTTMWLDPDISIQTFAEDDLGGYDSERGLLYMFDSNQNPDGYIGVKLLGPDNMPHTANIYEHPGPGNDNERFQVMTSGAISTPLSPADYRMLLTAQPFSLDVNDSVSVIFGLVMGAGLNELQTHCDTMTAIYHSQIVDIIDYAGINFPGDFYLGQNYPNPFNPRTVIGYQLPASSHVDLSIYNLLGQKVATLVAEKQQAGKYEVQWDSKGFASGIYIYELNTGTFRQNHKMILLR